MDKLKKQKLEKKGWKAGDVDEYLGLCPAEMELVTRKFPQIPPNSPKFPQISVKTLNNVLLYL